MIPRTQQRQRMSQQRKQKRWRAPVNVSDGRGGDTFTFTVNWQQRRWSRQRNTILITHQQRQMCWRRTMNRRCVWGIRDENRGDEGFATSRRDIVQRQKRRMMKTSTKTSITTTEGLAEYRWRAQCIRDNDGDSSSLRKGPMDYQQRGSVNFRYYRVVNSNTFSSIYGCCLVLMIFSLYYFFMFTTRKTINTAIMLKIYLYLVYTNLSHVTPTYSIV